MTGLVYKIIILKCQAGQEREYRSSRSDHLVTRMRNFFQVSDFVCS